MSDRIVLVLAMDPSHSDAVVTVIRDALKAAWEDDLFDGTQPFGPINLATGEDGDFVLDVSRPAESGGGLHVVLVESCGDGLNWALEHSLRCRKAGLLHCPLSGLVAIAVTEGHLDPGRWSVRREAGTLLWDEA